MFFWKDLRNAKIARRAIAQPCATNINFVFSNENPHFLLQIRILRKISWTFDPSTDCFYCAQPAQRALKDAPPRGCAKMWMYEVTKCDTWNFSIFSRWIAWWCPFPDWTAFWSNYRRKINFFQGKLSFSWAKPSCLRLNLFSEFLNVL